MRLGRRCIRGSQKRLQAKARFENVGVCVSNFERLYSRLSESFRLGEGILHMTRRKIMDYREKAINCVKDTVLPEQLRLFKECHNDLDELYGTDEETEGLFSKVIEPGHIYETGFPKCVCQEVLSGKVTDISHCECSRNSVLYIIEKLVPDKKVRVETIETVLGGAEHCRFRVIVETQIGAAAGR